MTSDGRAEPDKDAKWQENAAWRKQGEDYSMQKMTKRGE